VHKERGTNMIRFTVPGNPVGKGRARTCSSKFTGKVHSFTPGKTVSYENLVKILATEASAQYYASEPLTLCVTAYYEIPKSTSKKNVALMLAGNMRPIKKPDLDNIIKIVADALNGVCYHDDSQFVVVIAEKYYAEIARVEVEIGGVGEDG